MAEKAHLSFRLSSQSGYPQYISVIKCMDMSVCKVKGINGAFRTEAIFLGLRPKVRYAAFTMMPLVLIVQKRSFGGLQDLFMHPGFGHKPVLVPKVLTAS